MKRCECERDQNSDAEAGKRGASAQEQNKTLLLPQRREAAESDCPTPSCPVREIERAGHHDAIRARRRHRQQHPLAVMA